MIVKTRGADVFVKLEPGEAKQVAKSGCKLCFGRGIDGQIKGRDHLCPCVQKLLSKLVARERAKVISPGGIILPGSVSHA